MPYYSPELIRQIADANDIVEIVSQYVPLKKRGQNYVACCPFHNEKTPSFTVFPKENRYYCFGCHEKGDVFNFIQKKENYNFKEAVEYLANRANITLPKSNSQYEVKKAKEHQDIYNLNAKTGNYFYKNLKNSKKALGYLVERGIHSDMIFEFGLGYSQADWSDLIDYLKKQGINQELIDKAGLTRTSNNHTYDIFRDRLMIPIQNVYNKVIAFGGRKLNEQDKGPKYLNSPDTPVFNKRNQLFNLNRAKNYIRDTSLILVEGYMDVITLYSYGFKNVAAALGTAFTPDHAKLIERYTKSVTLCFDGDAAGEKATDRALDVLSKSNLKINVIRLPVEHDPDSYIREYGTGAFKTLFETAMPAHDYRLEKIKSKYDLNSSDQVVDYVMESCRFIASLNPIEQEVYLKKVADNSGVAIETIKNQLTELHNQPVKKTKDVKKNLPEIKKASQKTPSGKPKAKIPKELLEAQNIFLGYCYFKPEFIQTSKINETMLAGHFYKWFLTRLKFLNKEEPSVDELLKGEDNEKYQVVLTRFLEKINKSTENTALLALDVIRKYHRQREIARLENDLSKNEMNNERNLFESILDLRKLDLERKWTK